MATSFNYNIGAFPLGIVDTTELWIQIDDSSISSANLINISRLGNVVTIDFDANLSAPDEATLNGIVAAHLGNQPDVQVAEFIGSNRDPTPNDDETGDAALGTRWFNTLTNQQFVCLDPSAGAAIWKNLTQSVTELTTAEAFVAGDLVAMNSFGLAVKATSTFVQDKWRVIGVAINSVGIGGIVSLAKHGDLTPMKFSVPPGAATNGNYIFLNNTAGEASIIPPLGGGEVRFLVGILQGADGITTTPDAIFFPQYISRRPV